MTKLTGLNILGKPNDILDSKKGSDETLKNISTVSEDLLRVARKCMKMLMPCNSLRLNEVSILIFFQFYCKINRNQLQTVVEATYGLHSC